MQHAHHTWWLRAGGGAFLGLALLSASVAGVVHAYAGRILPNVTIGPAKVGGLTNTEAAAVLRREAAGLLDDRVTLTHEGQVVAQVKLAELGLAVPVDRLVTDALNVGRRGRGLDMATDWIRGVTSMTLPLHVEVKRETFRTTAERVFADRTIPARSASWTVSGGRLTFVPSAPGKSVNREQLLRDVRKHVGVRSPKPVSVRFVATPPDVSDDEARALRPEVERLARTPLVLVFGERRWEVPIKVRESAVTIERVAARPAATFTPEKLAAYLNDVIAPEVNQPAENARFELVDGRVNVFRPTQEGIVLSVDETVRTIRTAAAHGTPVVGLVVKRTTPAVTTTADIEHLGVRTILGRGESDFAGSPRNRIHNIRVGAARYHGVLIPPGKEFSFNEHLGPVTAATGYLPELVILENVTTPQYGGGLCQVSTTAFRAAVLSGLKITARKNHAYPVSYYGTPGFDATIYPPSPDLQFLNDTPGHILIQTKVAGTKLIFEFWGTSDGREVRIVGPSPYGRRPDGSVRATLTQQIFRDGTLAREETFQSSYKSPRLFPRVLAANAEQETWEERVRRIAERDRKAHEEFLRRQEEQARKTRPAPTPTPPPAEEP